MSALPYPDPSPMPSGRLVFGPQKPVVIMAGLALGAITAVCGGACLLNGSVSAALICILIAAFFGYIILGLRIWIDPERVGRDGFFRRVSCRRDELEALRIAPYGRRNAPTCFFVLKDGGVAFRVPAMIFGNQQLTALAAYLGVPLYRDI